MRHHSSRFHTCLPVAVFLTSAFVSAAARPIYRSPVKLAVSRDGRRVYVTNHTADKLSMINTATRKVIREIPTGHAPNGVAVSPDGKTVYVANTREHTVSFVDPVVGKLRATVRCGFEPRDLVVSADGKRLYTANYISDDVSVIDIARRKEVRRIKTGRGPTHLALTPDGKTLVVNHLLSHEPATKPDLSAHVAVVDTAELKVVCKVRSPGTMLLGQGIAVSPDGKWAACVHSRPNFNVTPSQLHQGWVHTNALTLIPLAGDGKAITVLLDNVSSGMANPHGVVFSRDGKTLFVSHRGTHQLSVVNLSKLHERLRVAKPGQRANAHHNLGFLWDRGDIVRRIGCGGLGPTGLAVHPKSGHLLVANYYSDNIAVINPASLRVIHHIALGKQPPMDLVRRGEFLFNDGGHCFQQWLSCASCHPDGARVDGVNWDLLNDGLGNPKNAKSLVGSWQTPPAMSLGVRASMDVAVEKGFIFIQFVQPRKGELDAVRAYLRAAPYIPSPWHRKADGTLDDTAARGKKLFKQAGCASCHPPPLYTDLDCYDVETATPRTRGRDGEFDTPSLIELYRTAPYLHDGRAATLMQVLKDFNKEDGHGMTSDLSEQQLKDLEAFLMTL